MSKFVTLDQLSSIKSDFTQQEVLEMGGEFHDLDTVSSNEFLVNDDFAGRFYVYRSERYLNRVYELVMQNDHIKDDKPTTVSTLYEDHSALIDSSSFFSARSSLITMYADMAGYDLSNLPLFRDSNVGFMKLNEMSLMTLFRMSVSINPYMKQEIILPGAR